MPAAADARATPEAASRPAPAVKQGPSTLSIMLRVLVRQALMLALAVLLGGWMGYPLQAACAVLVYVLLRQSLHMARLRRWVARDKSVKLPVEGGIWGEIYDGLHDLQRRNRKRKKKLAAILSEFQASTEALPDGAVVLGQRGEIVWFNDAAQALLGLRLPQDVGIRIMHLLRKPALSEYFARGEYKTEVESESPINNDVILSYRVIPYGNQQRLMIVRDVSDRRRNDQVRRDFVTNASHELRTPLTVLRGYLDMMEPESRTGNGPLSPWRAPLCEMRAQVTRMEALVGDLLKLARLESEMIQSRQDLLDAPKLLDRVAREAQALSGGRHRIDSQIEPGLRLFGRETEIISVFANLVNNAVQYTPDGGIISIRWASEDLGARFSVADTGIGIPEKDLQRVTERFYRVDVSRSRASGGTGLGLSIVKHALDHHESRLQIDSELGVGSTFSCVFPAHRVHREAELVARGLNGH